MTRPATAPAPRISALQQAWLLELGIQKPMLARYLPAPRALRPVDAPLAAPSRPRPPGKSLGAKKTDAPPATLIRSGGPAGALPASAPAPARIEPRVSSAGQVLVARPAELPHYLASLRASAEQCRVCSLCEGRSHVVFGDGRSEERRVGKEWVSTCGSRWSPYPSK